MTALTLPQSLLTPPTRPHIRRGYGNSPNCADFPPTAVADFFAYETELNLVADCHCGEPETTVVRHLSSSGVVGPPLAVAASHLAGGASVRGPPDVYSGVSRPRFVLAAYISLLGGSVSRPVAQ